MSKFKSVWDAISNTPEESASMKARSEMMMAVASVVEGWKVPQRVAAERLGVLQPRVNDLLQGRIARFSMEALFDLAAKAKLHPAFTMSSQRRSVSSQRSRPHARVAEPA